VQAPQGETNRFVIGRENNVVRVDFRRDPDPPAPKFPGASGLREISDRGASQAKCISAAALRAVLTYFPNVNPGQCTFFCSAYGNDQANLT
jgi:hypothetical protein